MKKAILLLSVSALFVLGSCQSTSNTDSSQSTSETSKVTSSSTQESAPKESSSLQSSTTESSTVKSSTTESATVESSKLEKDAIEKGEDFILGKWRTKEADAHVILEDTYLANGVMVNFSDARGTETEGHYQVLAYDGSSITLKKDLNGGTTTVTYQIKDNGNELSVYFPESEMTQNFVRIK